MSAVIGFILPGTVSQIGLAMVIVMLVCILYGKYSPYVDGRQDFMQLFCQIQMFLVLFFSILIKAQSTEEFVDESRGADSAYVTEKMLIISTILPIMAAFGQVYLTLIEPMWALWRASKHDDPKEKHTAKQAILEAPPAKEKKKLWHVKPPSGNPMRGLLWHQKPKAQNPLQAAGGLAGLGLAVDAGDGAGAGTAAELPGLMPVVEGKAQAVAVRREAHREATRAALTQPACPKRLIL